MLGNGGDIEGVMGEQHETGKLAGSVDTPPSARFRGRSRAPCHIACEQRSVAVVGEIAPS